jgi:hypothetical protein
LIIYLSAFKVGQNKAKQALQELVILPALNPEVCSVIIEIETPFPLESSTIVPLRAKSTSSLEQNFIRFVCPKFCILLACHLKRIIGHWFYTSSSSVQWQHTLL